VHVHPERVHVGEPLLGGPLRARRQRLPAVADDRDLLTTLVLLAAQRVPVAAVLGRLPEALWCQMRVNVDAPHRSPPGPAILAPCPYASPRPGSATGTRSTTRPTCAIWPACPICSSLRFKIRVRRSPPSGPRRSADRECTPTTGRCSRRPDRTS
jgi:hypothetical protein